MTFDWAYAWEILPRLLTALRLTLCAAILGITLASALGLVWVSLRRNQLGFVRWTAHYAVEFIRSTPVLVQIYFLFYLAPGIGLSLSPMVTGVIALGIHYSAYLAEVYRAGIEAVPAGQWEAARALNLSQAQTWRLVVLPQAIPPVIPAMGNYLVAMFKDTPMLSTITVLELLQTAKVMGSESFRYLEPLTLVGAFFLALSLAAAVMIRWTERRFRLKGALT